MTGSSVRDLYVRELLERLTTDVAYCVLHGYECLPRVGSDLDLAVRPDHYDLARRIVCDVATRHGGLLLKDVRYDIGDSSYLIVGLSDGSVIVIDILFDRSPVGAYGLDSVTLCARRRPIDFYYAPAPDVEAEYLLSKRSFKGELPPDQLQKIRETAAFDVPDQAAAAIALGRARCRARRRAAGRVRLAALRVRKVVRRAAAPVGDYFAADGLRGVDLQRLSMIYRRVVRVPPMGPAQSLRWIAAAPVRRIPLHAHVFEGHLPGVEHLGDPIVLRWLAGVR